MHYLFQNGGSSVILSVFGNVEYEWRGSVIGDACKLRSSACHYSIQQLKAIDIYIYIYIFFKGTQEFGTFSYSGMFSLFFVQVPDEMRHELESGGWTHVKNAHIYDQTVCMNMHEQKRHYGIMWQMKQKHTIFLQLFLVSNSSCKHARRQTHSATTSFCLLSE